MKQLISWVLIAALAGGLARSPAPAATRLKDLASIDGVRDNQLIGYGLVVGLAGTGDRRQTIFSAQSLANMLQRMGVTVNPAAIRVTNTAAVIVTSSLPAFSRPGAKVDILVSAIGDASNLQGGTLIVTPLRALDGQVYASAQGPVVTGGFVAAAAGAARSLNHPTVGRVPEGATIERPAPSALPSDAIRWVLHRADFTTADRIAELINKGFPAQTPIATTEDGGTVRVVIPPDYAGRNSAFIAQVERIEVETDTRARIVVNERTGTIVIGGGVTIRPVSILHGGLQVEITTRFQVSQPNAFSQGGTTQVVPETSMTVNERQAKGMTLNAGATVENLVQGLTSIGATPRDIIAILQNLRAAGALDADLEVI